MNGYSPGAGHHAVEQAVVGIRFRRQANDGTFRAAVDMANVLAHRHNLPGRVQLDALALSLGRQVISSGHNTEANVSPGMVFQRVHETGAMAEELTLERGAVTYRTHSYARWKDVVQLLNGIVCPVAAALSSGNADLISVIELRCIDRFVAESSKYPPLSDLIRVDTPFVPQHLLTKKEMLHSHIGWFENQTESARTLVNLNVEIVDGIGDQRSATILQVISLQSSGVGQFLNSNVEFTTNIIDAFNNLHMIDKNLLANLITDKLQGAINLNGDSGTVWP